MIGLIQARSESKILKTGSGIQDCLDAQHVHCKLTWQTKQYLFHVIEVLQQDQEHCGGGLTEKDSRTVKGVFKGASEKYKR